MNIEHWHPRTQFPLRKALSGLVLALNLAAAGGAAGLAQDSSQSSQGDCEGGCRIVSDLQTMGIPAEVAVFESPISRIVSLYRHNPPEPTDFGLRLHEILSRLDERERAQLQFRLARNDHAALAEAVRVLQHVVEYDSSGASAAYPEPVQAYMTMAENILKPKKQDPALAPPEAGKSAQPVSVREVLLEHRAELESRRSLLEKVNAGADGILSRVLGEDSEVARKFSQATRTAMQDLNEATESIDALTGYSGRMTSRALLTLVRTLPERSLNEAQWKAVASAFPAGASVNRMEIMKLWRSGLTGKGVRVGMVGDGADAAHPDLTDVHVAKNFTEERYQDPLMAGLPDDRGGQGTYLAGIVRALAPDAEIRVYKSIENQPDQVPPEMRLKPIQTMESAANALQCAADDGCTVVNLEMNWKDDGHAIRPDRLSNKAEHLDGEGVVVIQPVGDSGSGSIDVPAYSPHVLAVGSADYTQRQALFSSEKDVLVQDEAGKLRIVRKPDCLAYGWDVCSAQYDPESAYKNPGQDYMRQSGTPVAAAHVAAVVALLQQKARALHKTLTPEQTRQIIREQGADVKEGPYGVKLVDAHAAVQHLETEGEPDREP